MPSDVKTRPYKPRVIKREAKQEVRQEPKEIEIVFGGTVVIVGRNPDTGRIRITIEG
jgi:ABC-type phosphate transport system substrate-binding protein